MTNLNRNYYFPVPDFLAMHTFALDISDQSIKYGKLVSTHKGLHLVNYGQERIPKGVVVSGKIENDKELVSLLNKIREVNKIRFVRVSLPEEQMYLFNILLPKIDYKEIRDTILLQLEEHIPLSPQEACFDYEVISENKDGILVNVAATSVEVIESYLSVFEQASLVPVSFELEAQAIARAVLKKENESTVMIVDFGETRTGISIAEGDKVVFSSTFDMGGYSLTEAIAKNFNISFEEAEKMKRSYKKTDINNKEDIFPIILNNLSVLRDELSKHFTYWHTHDSEEGAPRSQVEKIILCGGDANLVGIADYLSATMNVKVVYADAWINIIDIEKETPTMPFGQSLGYLTVIGLALADFIEE